MTATGLTLSVAAFFLIMGLTAFVDPERIVEFFGTTMLTTDGRNEVRAVYGGFGVVMALLLVSSLWFQTVHAGVHVTLAAALAGMASGRLVSRWIDGTAGRNPWLFFVVELALAALLVGALVTHGGASA